VKLRGRELVNVALAVLALASVAAVVLTRNAPTTAEKDARASNLLAAFREEEVERLEFRRGPNVTVVERSSDGASYLLRGPSPEPADAAAVERLIDGLGFATPLRRLGTTDPGPLGLTSPRATLVLVMRGKSTRLSLGKAAPAPAGAVYVGVSGDGITPFSAVVSREVAALLETTANDLRDRNLVTLGVSELAELGVESPDASLRLVRTAGASFRLDGAGRARRDALDPLFTALAEMRADPLVDVALAERSRGSAPRTLLRLAPRDGTKSKTVLELGGNCPEKKPGTLAIVRGTPPRAGCVRDEVVRAFAVTREALLDDTAFWARPDEVETLTVVRGERRLVLTRSGTAFVLREPASAAVELDAGNARLAAVVRAGGELLSGADLAKLGLSPARDKVVLTVLARDDQAREETLELGRVEPDGTLVGRRVEDGAVLRFSREAARAFLVDATLLRPRRLLDFPLSGLVELETSRPERQLLRRVPTGLELAVPAGFRTDGSLTTEAALALGSLTAVRWVADADDGSFGLGAPRLTVRLRFDADGGATERTLVVGGAAPGGYHARFGDDQGVFLLERAVVERLETLFIDRAAPMVDPETLARIRLRRGDKTLTLERRGGVLVATAGTSVDQAVLTPALEALAALRAEAAVHTGKARPSEGLAAPVLEISADPSPGLGGSRRLQVGSQEVFRGVPVRYARVEGIDATFVIAESKIRPVLELF
jgi:hypothetical protein